MKHIVCAPHWRNQAVRISNVAQVEPHRRHAKRVSHVVLLFLVAAKDANFSDARVQIPTQDRVAESARAASNDKYAVVESSHHEIPQSTAVVAQHRAMACY
jgi:hypothetical protein